MTNLIFENGEIKSVETGQTVAFINREAGGTPLSPVERDELANVFAAAPETLVCLIKFIKAWNNEAAPTTMIKLYNDACQAITKAGYSAFYQNEDL